MSGTFRPLAATFALGALLALAAPAPAQKPFDDPVLDRMQKDIFFLASPECEGRGIDTKGIEKAADRIVEVFREAGLKPAMKDGTYFQPFAVTISAKLGKSNALTLSGPRNARAVGLLRLGGMGTMNGWKNEPSFMAGFSPAFWNAAAM